VEEEGIERKLGLLINKPLCSKTLHVHRETQRDTERHREIERERERERECVCVCVCGERGRQQRLQLKKRWPYLVVCLDELSLDLWLRKSERIIM